MRLIAVVLLGQLEVKGEKSQEDTKQGGEVTDWAVRYWLMGSLPDEGIGSFICELPLTGSYALSLLS